MQREFEARFQAELASKRLQLVDADVLDCKLATEQVCAGNIPYSISSKIMKHVIRNWPSVSRAVFLVQHEFAEKIAANAGDKKFGPLAVLLQHFAQIDIVKVIGKELFEPVPKVCLTRRARVYIEQLLSSGELSDCETNCEG
jgi:16S rRNA A1518/A1519 N6-dimethyltransferase RsmA/KsgA/DIM1 with predicted DNA glycosylase/AP lyase activity